MFRGSHGVAKDFITKIFVVEPKQRLTADQCLDHEWLTTTPLSSEPLHKSSSSFAKFQESQRALKAKQQRMPDLISVGLNYNSFLFSFRVFLFDAASFLIE